MTTYYVTEIYGVGEKYPIPGGLLLTVEADNAIDALNAYSDREGFAPYAPVGSTDPDAIIPHVWNDEGSIASAPFTNYEIVAFSVEAMLAAGMVAT